MNKAFVRESEGDDDEELEPALKLPAGTRNYITPAGHARLREELEELVKRERPKVVDIVSWAASNGDRSENGDYIYGKRRLREIDRRIRFLSKRLDIAEIVDPLRQGDNDRCSLVQPLPSLTRMAAKIPTPSSALTKRMSSVAVSAGSLPWRERC